MIRSMTAFARLKATAAEGGWLVEIRSINHRYLDFSVKLPGALSILESRIRDVVQARISRGKVTVGISRDLNGEAPKVSVNEESVEFYLGTIRKLKKKFKLSGDLSVADLLGLPGIFMTDKAEEDPEKSWPGIKKALERAIDKAIQSKQVEGKKLATDILERLAKIAVAVKTIETQAAGKVEAVFKKLVERVETLLQEKEKDPERVNREVAFLAERCDITEELVRLKSHLDLFGKRLKVDGEVGRELDFLCQEMNREINTVASKSQNFDIATETVFVKGEIEKIREQVQNIE